VIEPHQSYVFRRTSVMLGTPVNMHVQILGVVFDDQSIWGSMNSSISTRDWWASTPDQNFKISTQSR
jgi:hypothetical protein